jgi:Tol biopolymer transport system component
MFLSPKGNSVAFYTLDGLLKSTTITGGHPRTISDALGQNVLRKTGGTWTSKGWIVLASNRYKEGLIKIKADGTNMTVLTEKESAKMQHMWPHALPDGDHILFSSQSDKGTWTIEVVNVFTDDPPKKIVGPSKNALCRPIFSPTGYLFYAMEGDLFAVSFNSKTLETKGEAFIAKRGIGMNTSQGIAQYDVSPNGTFVYLHVPGRGYIPQTLKWTDSKGEITLATEEKENWFLPSVDLSPDGKKVAMIIDFEICIIDLESGLPLRYLVKDGIPKSNPVWSYPDGRSVFFIKKEENQSGLYRIAADFSSNEGEAELIFDSFPPDLTVSNLIPTKNEDSILIKSTHEQGSEFSLFHLQKDRDALELVYSSRTNRELSLSPDSKWLAYVDGKDGDDYVYVKPFHQEGAVEMVSGEGARYPVWSKDGKQLYFQRRNKIYSIDMLEGQRKDNEEPKVAFELPAGMSGEEWALDWENDRILISTSADEDADTSGASSVDLNTLRITYNFDVELKRTAQSRLR